MNFIYKLMGMAVAVAEEAGVETATLTENATELVETGEQVAETPLWQSIVGGIGSFFPLIIVFVLMYFLMIRPEKKRKKKEQDMLSALKRGDRICTIGGIYGTIADIKDDTITLTVGRDNMSMVVTRWAVRSVEDVAIENESESLN